MIHLNLHDLEKVKKICEEAGTEYFTLEEETKSGIGSILTVCYDTIVADHPAIVRVEVRGVESW
jgi:hypothetical protein